MNVLRIPGTRFFWFIVDRRSSIERQRNVFLSLVCSFTNRKRVSSLSCSFGPFFSVCIPTIEEAGTIDYKPHEGKAKALILRKILYFFSGLCPKTMDSRWEIDWGTQGPSSQQERGVCGYCYATCDFDFVFTFVFLDVELGQDRIYILLAGS